MGQLPSLIAAAFALGVLRAAYLRAWGTSAWPAALDPLAMPSYLEATTRGSAEGVYTRAGYRPLGEPTQFPEGLQIYLLWRDPQPAREEA
jgi:hypothetical protein